MSASSSSSHTSLPITRLLLTRIIVLLAALPRPLEAGPAAPRLLVNKSESRLEVLVNSTTGSFVARAQDFEVTLTLGPEAGRIHAAHLRADFASIKTGLESRDKDMNAWQQTDRFRNVEFTLVSLVPAGGATYTAQGLLRLHGVERSVTFPVSIADGRRLWTLDGDAALDTRSFNMQVITMFMVLRVDPIVHVRFHIQASESER